ncbi:hypothetical protein RSM1_29185 [Methylobacterium radiotolerans]|nr:hypothetical protein RSM1_29185 [Methylobacterium radiotolerans]
MVVTGAPLMATITSLICRPARSAMDPSSMAHIARPWLPTTFCSHSAKAVEDMTMVVANKREHVRT